MRVSAKADYAVRACVELAARGGGNPVPLDALSVAQGIPGSFLERILADLRRAGIVVAVRGPRGGYRLGPPASEVSLADVIRAVDGPLVTVRGARPPDLSYEGPSESLLRVWIALRASVRAVLDETSLADVAETTLPADVDRLASEDSAWDNP